MTPGKQRAFQKLRACSGSSGLSVFCTSSPFTISVNNGPKRGTLQVLTLSRMTNFRLFQIERVCR